MPGPVEHEHKSWSVRSGSSTCQLNTAPPVRAGGAVFGWHVDDHDLTEEELQAGRPSVITHSMSVMLSETAEATPASAMRVVRLYLRVHVCPCVCTLVQLWVTPTPAWQAGHDQVEYGRRRGSFVLFHAQDTHQTEPIPSTVTAAHLKATFFFSKPLRAANNQQVAQPRLSLMLWYCMNPRPNVRAAPSAADHPPCAGSQAQGA